MPRRFKKVMPTPAIIKIGIPIYAFHITRIRHMDPVTKVPTIMHQRSNHFFFSCGVGRERMCSHDPIARIVQMIK